MFEFGSKLCPSKVISYCLERNEVGVKEGESITGNEVFKEKRSIRSATQDEMN